MNRRKTYCPDGSGGGGVRPLSGGPLLPNPSFRGEKIDPHEDGALKTPGSEASAQCCGLRAGGPHRIQNRHPETFVLSSSRLVPFQNSPTCPSNIFGRYPKLL